MSGCSQCLVDKTLGFGLQSTAVAVRWHTISRLTYAMPAGVEVVSKEYGKTIDSCCDVLVEPYDW